MRAGISIGAWVRVADAGTLESFLREPDPAERPEPGQFRCQGQAARVVGVRLDHGEPHYLLEGLPGLWRETWIQHA